MRNMVCELRAHAPLSFSKAILAVRDTTLLRRVVAGGLRPDHTGEHALSLRRNRVPVVPRSRDYARRRRRPCRLSAAIAASSAR